MLLDIGIGIFSAIILAKLFAFPLTVWFVLFGIAFALLPDIDFIYTLLRNGLADERIIARHRDLVHYPLIYVPIGFLLTLPFGLAWACLFLLGSLGHFIHDSIGLGWGIPWAWPLVNKNYSFLYRYSAPGKQLPKQLVYCWKRDQLDELIRDYGDKNWLENIYLGFHPFFVTEIVVFLVALFVLWRSV